MIFSANGRPPHPSTHVTSVAIYRGIGLACSSFVVMQEPDCNQL